MNKEAKQLMEYLSAMNITIEDWQNELENINERLKESENLRFAKTLVEEKIEELKANQPKFFLDKVYKKEGTCGTYVIIKIDGTLRMYNIVTQYRWNSRGVKTSCIKSFYSNSGTLRNYITYEDMDILTNNNAKDFSPIN